MSGKLLGTRVDVKLEVEPGKWIEIVFDRKEEFVIVPWQDAFSLTQTMTQIIADVGSNWPKSLDTSLVKREENQIKLSWDADVVVIMVEWTDRIRFTTLEAFYRVLQAISLCAQDAQLASEKGIRFEYDRQGMIRKLHNLRSGITQFVR